MKLLIILYGPYDSVIGIKFSIGSVKSQLNQLMCDLTELTMLDYIHVKY